MITITRIFVVNTTMTREQAQREAGPAWSRSGRGVELIFPGIRIQEPSNRKGTDPQK